MKNKLFGKLGENISQNMVLPIVLMSVAFVGLMTYNLVGNINEKMKQERLQNLEQQVQEQPPQAVETNDEQENIPVETPKTDVPQQEDTPVETAVEEVKPRFVLPVSGGKIYARFSGDELVYNRTMDDWRTHNGVDIYGKKGDAVNAGADGTVQKIYEDPLLGHTVVISHDGFDAVYSGLAKNVLVSRGASVYQGQPIGTIDEIPLEVNDESHVHLEIQKDGKNVNPDTIL